MAELDTALRLAGRIELLSASHQFTAHRCSLPEEHLLQVLEQAV
jgi:hypothetical protein